MTSPTRTQAENSLAALIHSIRPDWPTPSILAQLRAKPNTPLEVLAAGALWATSRRDQHDPKVIREDNGHAWDRITGRQQVVPAPQPTRGCPYHPGQPRFGCAECAEYTRNAIRDPARIRAIREQYRTTQETA